MASPKKFKSVFSADSGSPSPAPSMSSNPAGNRTSGRERNGLVVVGRRVAGSSYTEGQVTNNNPGMSNRESVSPRKANMGSLPIPTPTAAGKASTKPATKPKPAATTTLGATTSKVGKKRKVPMKDRPRRPDGKLMQMNEIPYVDRRSRNPEPIEQIVSCINPPPGGTRAYVVMIKGRGQRTMPEDEVKKSSPRVLREWKRLQY